MTDQPLKISEFLTYLAPDLVRNKRSQCPKWPADAFALAAALLEKSNAYPHIGIQVDLTIRHRGRKRNDRVGFIKAVADEWRKTWERQAPEFVRDLWKGLMDRFDTEVGTIREDHDLCAILINLLAIADEVMSGVGLQPSHESDSAFSFETQTRLWPTEYGSSLCRKIHPTRLRVLPKSQTPVSGLSLRSLTHHLALCPPVEVKASWYSDVADGVRDTENGSLNLLLIPWPFKIEPTQFRSFTPPGEYYPNLVTESDGRWFSYIPHQIAVGQIVDLVEKYVSHAERLIGEDRIDVVVFPELALTVEQYTAIVTVLLPRGIGVIAGIAAGEDPEAWGSNCASLVFPSLLHVDGYLELIQSKHHRWRLEQNQIVRYGLSSELDPHLDWWEGIRLDDREINFLRLRKWLSMCVLICEDLARLDPIGRFVRAVAPDLVIALLLDGPQLGNRWPAYHATVLADDPGCSVLTLTSLGMTQLSTMKESIGHLPRPVIGLWRDSVHGLVEIMLPPGATAAVLTLTRHRPSRAERTADGRDHCVNQGFPVYGGLNFIHVPSNNS